MIGIAAFYMVLFAVLCIMRLLYPFEVEFVEGLMAEHSLRLLQNKQIYDQPQLEFIAAIYQPFYYYVAALSMKVFGIGLFAGRLVSVLATLGSAALIGVIVYRFTRNSWACFTGIALFIAAYGATGYFYDIVRVDSLFVFLLLSGLSLLVLSEFTPGRLLASAILLSLAFFTKQQALGFIVCVAVWTLVHKPKQGILFTIYVAIFIASGIIILDAINDGWYSYYVYGIPSAKKEQFSWYSFFATIPDTILQYWSIAMLFIVVWIGKHLRSPLSFLKSREGLLAMFTLVAIVMLMASYGNLGGYRNVAIPLAAMIAIALPISLHSLSTVIPKVALDGALVLQLAGLWTSPLWEGKLFSSAENKAAGKHVISQLRAREGNVLTLNHGFLTHLAGKPMQFQQVSYSDALLAKDEFAAELERSYDSALKHHAYSAIIVDEDPISDPDSIPGYSLQGRLIEKPGLFYSKLLDIGTRPQYLYLPKQTMQDTVSTTP